MKMGNGLFTWAEGVGWVWGGGKIDPPASIVTSPSQNLGKNSNKTAVFLNEWNPSELKTVKLLVFLRVPQVPQGTTEGLW